PSANGFNPAVYTSNGYAVLMPDIVYQVNDPGMSAVWCVLPALEAAIATGVVDRDRVGLHGHSWGGYQTAFLITQTEAFKAAVDWNQGIEYFNTLRRLRKPVILLQYKGENHGLVKPANRKDYTVRMREFFDHHLRDMKAHAWLEKGVPHLELDEHLEERVKEL